MIEHESIDVRYTFATSLIREAGHLAKRDFADVSGLSVNIKGPQDVVSKADLETEDLIRSHLKQRFPQDGFVGEGFATVNPGGMVWVVDPIDGTQVFLLGIASWCVSIALVVDGKTEIGLVFDPVADELFAARRDLGATLNGRVIRAKPRAQISDGLVSVGYPKRMQPEDVLPGLKRLLDAGGMFHRNGSGALSLCYVGCGRLLGYVEAHMNSWDCLAGLIIVAESGGRTSDFLTGGALTDGNRVVAAAYDVYDELDRILGY